MDSQGLFILAGIAVFSFVLGFAGATVGLVLGHFRLPLLLAYLHSASAAASTNLAVSGLGALAGTFRHAREGRVSPVVLVLVGVPSAVGAVIGVLLFVKLNRLWAHILLGVALIFLGIETLRRRASAADARQVNLPRGPRLLLEIGIGVFLGALASITGLMMNGLRLPMLIRLLHIDPKVAVGSNMAIGFFTALVGAITAWWTGGGFDLLTVAVVGPPTMLGSYLGAWVTGWLKKELVQRLLGVMITIMGVVMTAQGFWKVTRARDYQAVPHTPAEVHEVQDEEDEWPEWP